MASGEVNTSVKYKVKYKDLTIDSFNLAANTGTYKDVTTDLGPRAVAITCICNKWEVIMKVQSIASTYIRICYRNAYGSAQSDLQSKIRVAYI